MKLVTEGQSADSKQHNSKQLHNESADIKQQSSQQSCDQSTDREQTFNQLVNQPIDENSESLSVSEVWIRMLSVNKSYTCCNTNVVGSVYKVDVIVGGIPTRAFIDSGSQVCIVRKQLLPYIKEKQNWSVSNCLARHLSLDTQPLEQRGSPLGAKAKPIWQGEVWNCGMIMGTNSLVGFDFRITHSNGIEVITESLLQQLCQAGNLLESQKLPEVPTIESLDSQESVSLPVSLSELPSLPLLFTGDTAESLAEPVASSTFQELVTTT